MALVLSSTCLALIVGVPIGVWTANSNRAEKVIHPILDLMQTMPAFVYLIPAVLFFGLAAAFAVRAQGGTYPVSGRVIDRLSRRPVAYAAVVLAGQEQKGASTDSLGRFRIERVKPGIWRLAVSSVGYKSLTTPEYMVSAATPFIEVELEEDAAQLEAVTVRPSPFRVTAESPVSLKVIGLRPINNVVDLSLIHI